MGVIDEMKIFHLNVFLNSIFNPSVRVNSITLEITCAHIFAILIVILLTLYNVLAADCLPVRIGVNYE